MPGRWWGERLGLVLHPHSGIVAIIAAILALEQILEHKRIMAGIFDESEGEE